MPSQLTFTPRQYEVLALLAQGMTAVEIGEALQITPRWSSPASVDTTRLRHFRLFGDSFVLGW